MKKSIVLLITLFFIATISVYILQNLKSTNTLLNEVAYDSSISQIQITMDDIRKEIPKYLKKNEKDIDTILENIVDVPLQYGDINLVLHLSKYNVPQFNINNLTTKDFQSDDFVNNIISSYEFKQLISKNKPFNNQSQIKQILNEYINLTNSSDILNIKDEFTYLASDTNTTLIQCDYTVVVNTLKSDVSFIFDLNSSKIVNLDISF